MVSRAKRILDLALSAKEDVFVDSNYDFQSDSKQIKENPLPVTVIDHLKVQNKDTTGTFTAESTLETDLQPAEILSHFEDINNSRIIVIDSIDSNCKPFNNEIFLDSLECTVLSNGEQPFYDVAQECTISEIPNTNNDVLTLSETHIESNIPSESDLYQSTSISYVNHDHNIKNNFSSNVLPNETDNINYIVVNNSNKVIGCSNINNVTYNDIEDHNYSKEVNSNSLGSSDYLMYKLNDDNEMSPLYDEITDDPSYIPSEEEASESGDSNSTDNSDNNNDLNEPSNVDVNLATEEVNSKKTNKRARRGKAVKQTWMYETNKRKRMKGEEYLGRRKSDGKIVFDVKRKERQIKPPCSCSMRQRSSKFSCEEFDEYLRKEIFKTFWTMTWGERKVFIQQLVDFKPVKQRKVEVSTSRRTGTLSYHLKKQEGSRLQVCKTMFLNTICIGEWTVANWVKQSKNNTEERTNKLKRSDKKRQQDSSSHKIIKEFFNLLPKLPSHYCRKQTNKLYLEPVWQSKANLYREYEKFCKSKSCENNILSYCVFSDKFNDENLSLYSPKKDQCDLCHAHKIGNVDENVYVTHLLLKEEARNAKDHDKTKSDNSVAVFTIDLQAVLLCPSLKVSAVYYKTKLKVHNLTIYNLKTAEGYCFLWDESQGGLNADEFSSILCNFITTKVNTEVIKEVIIYTDGCCYQNRNSILSNALFLTAVKTKLIITQKYLEKGHTQMECDSMHASIERQLKNREIYSPGGYVEACRTARFVPQPYKVECLQYSFFKSYGKLTYLRSIRPGTKSGDPLVTDIRCIQYNPHDISVKYKLHFSDSYSDLPQRIMTKPTKDDFVDQLYTNQLPIQCSKYRHLQQLKEVIPKDVHYFYDNLSCDCSDINCKVLNKN